MSLWCPLCGLVVVVVEDEDDDVQSMLDEDEDEDDDEADSGVVVEGSVACDSACRKDGQ